MPSRQIRPAIIKSVRRTVGKSCLMLLRWASFDPVCYMVDNFGVGRNIHNALLSFPSQETKGKSIRQSRRRRTQFKHIQVGICFLLDLIGPDRRQVPSGAALSILQPTHGGRDIPTVHAATFLCVGTMQQSGTCTSPIRRKCRHARHLFRVRLPALVDAKVLLLQ